MFERAILCLTFGTLACTAVASENPTASRENESREDEASLISESLQRSMFQATLPENTSNIQELDRVTFYHCQFSAGTAQQAPPFPPQHLVWLHREPVNDRLCPAGYVILGSSFGFPTVNLARHPFLPALVASFTTQSTPSGSAHVQLQLVQPSYGTGAILHRATLAAMSPSSTLPQLGNVLSGELNLSFDGTLTVSGQKNGLLVPAESPPGAPNYVATYDFFLFDPNPQPIPDDISTF